MSARTRTGGRGRDHRSGQASATLDPDDLELALRYLDGFSVVVVAEPLDAPPAIVADAVAYDGATLIVLVPVDDDGPTPRPTRSCSRSRPHDPDGVFARTVGEFAAELDRGAEPGRRTRLGGRGPGLATGRRLTLPISRAERAAPDRRSGRC